MDRQKVYNSNIDRYNAKVKELKSKIIKMSLLRLFIFVCCALGVYFFWESTLVLCGIILFFIISFIFLVKKHTELKEAKEKTKILIDINHKEIEAINGDFSSFSNGKYYKNPSHEFAEDIDLFGEKSFFQFLNRTGLKEGQDKLSELLLSNDIFEISKKQNAVKELSEKLNFRQHFTADARMLEDEDKLQYVLKSLKNHSYYVPKKAQLLSYIFSGLSLVFIGLYAFEIISEMQLLLWIFIGMGITSIYLKRTNNLSQITAKAQDIFRQYQKLIYAVENEKFESELLTHKQSLLSQSEKPVSALLLQFSKHIDNLEQRQNFLLGFILNAFCLWDLQQGYRIEKWLETNAHYLFVWFETIAEFDAYNSFGNLAYNQTSYTFPEINNNQEFILNSTSASHPLIPKQLSISNDFSIKSEDFLIITGANMAGKSTFLRTVSLSIVMANLGLPVCAENCVYKPIKLITSMRTSDSLSDESSYFFSELSRLKTIIDHLDTDHYFIVLDEILKGTNSHDKAKGSQEFIEKLVKTKSSGIIATHDLSLCQLSEKLEQVHNYYFDAQIINDELYFDYKFKKGICQNMNASFLLKKMGIV